MNVENIRALARKLRRLRHEKHYDQAYWSTKSECGTAACLAGHAIVMAGLSPIYEQHDDDEISATYCRRGRHGEWLDIYSEAQRWLGMARREACRLFSSNPSLDWPSEYSERWDAVRYNKSVERPSRIAADLLDAIVDGKVAL